LRANELHRGFTHSILFSAAMAPVLAIWLKRHAASLLTVFTLLVALTFVQGAENGLVRGILLVVTAGIIVLIFRRRRLPDGGTHKEWSWLFWWSLVTHPLLDCHTTWGTQLFWPLPWKLSWNNIFVVDPLYTVPFMICVGIVMFIRRDNARRRWVNWLGIGISSAYMLFTIVCKRIAVGAIASSLDRQHIPYVDFTTRPTPFNSILWSVNVDAGDHYLLGYHSLLDTKPEVEFVRVDKGLQNLGLWVDQRQGASVAGVVRSQLRRAVHERHHRVQRPPLRTDGRTFTGQALRVRLPARSHQRRSPRGAHPARPTTWRGPRNAVE
jgi:membrane-bound metal-dependent hydrolase YbcI (DUF457 family)